MRPKLTFSDENKNEPKAINQDCWLENTLVRCRSIYCNRVIAVMCLVSRFIDWDSKQQESKKSSLSFLCV